MPAAARELIAGEAVLFQAEGIVVAFHQRGRVPGRIVHRGQTRTVGSFAVTDRRVIATGRKGILVNVPYDEQRDGPVTITLGLEGLRVDFDLDRVHPACHGKLWLEFREEIPAETLASFPQLTLTYVANPQAVVRLFGSRRRLPDT
jgi:hypothetical protein